MAPHLSTEEGLTVEYRSVETSAKVLCDSKTAMGPDYVNVPEGIFCRSEFVSFIALWCALVKFSSLPLLSPCLHFVRSMTSLISSFTVSDKTLFPLCELNDTGGLHEHCFNVESQELVLRGRKLLKRSQYAFVRHRGRESEESEGSR